MILIKTQQRILRASLAVLIAFSTGLPAIANNTGEIQPGLPTRRSGGGRRGLDTSEVPTLTALIPESRLGLTSLPRPTLYFYVPEVKHIEAIELVFRDQDDRLIYDTFLSPLDQAGIVAINLSEFDNFPALKVGQNYHWYFSVLVDKDNRSRDMVVEGWIKRVKLEPTLSQKLEIASSAEQLQLYLSNDLWYDSLNQLVTLQNFYPDDRALSTRWIQFMDSVGLGELAFEIASDTWIDAGSDSETLRQLLTKFQQDVN